MADVSKIRVDGVDYDVKDTTARSVLNTKMKSTPTLLSDNTDLNSMTNFGFYYCSSNVKAETLINCPTKDAFFMQIGLYFYNQYYQRIITFSNNTPIIYFRNGGGDNWGQWFREYTTIDSPLPSVTTSDNGKILKVVNGVWTAVAE